MKSKIEWTDRVWNPFTGCSWISEACDHCYARRMAKRLAGRNGYPKDDPFRPTFHPNMIERPLGWSKPSNIFVCSMSDLLHEDHSSNAINMVFDTMSKCKRHNFQILTKRPWGLQKVNSYYSDNIWLGATVENQAMLELRLPFLLKGRSRIKFLSVEPMLGRLDLKCVPGIRHIDWIICGGESGNEKSVRQTNPEHVESLRDQCVELGIKFFFKQWGMWKPVMKGNAINNGRIGNTHYFDNGWMMMRVKNKKDSGHKIAGQEWRQFPE